MRRVLLAMVVCLAACTSPPPPPVTEVTPTPVPCVSPRHLVRDLTIPWGQRRYLIGPCPQPAAAPSEQH